MRCELVDTHAHLDEIEPLAPALDAAREAGVVAIIAVGSDIASNRRVLEIAAQHPRFVYAALGLHPDRLRPTRFDEELNFIRTHLGSAVAVGEVGLDYHKRVRENADKGIQRDILRELLKIARQQGKPAIIHSRYAWRDAFDVVREVGLEKAVFHWFTGPSSVLRDIVAAGYYLSATPAVAYHEEHRRAIRECPLDRLLLETDAPVTYRRGTPQEFRALPADAVRSLTAVAAARGTPEEAVARATTANARALFGV